MRSRFLAAMLLFPLSAYADDVVIQSAAGTHLFHVEIARTDAEHEKGLMFRKALADDAGMLFLFDDNAPRSFWMKNTLIPLDVIFIDAQGRIVNIHAGAKPHDLTPLSSTGPVTKALEIKGGRAAALGLQPGDQVLVK